jgi:hypothetical protein
MTRRRREQQGAALLIVLAAIALTSAVMLALLALSLSSLQLTRTRAEVAAEQRAIDGALEAGVGRVALSTAPNPCADVPGGSTLDFSDESMAAGGTIEVGVRCDPLPLPAAVPEDGSDEVLGGPAVEIVGQSYGGSLTVPTGIISGPTLVHTGSLPLLFESDVTVARGAAARSTDADGPAVSATGQYLQGLTGPAGTGSVPCGDLDPAGSQPSIAIDDRDASPECSSATATALAPRVGTIFSSVDVVSDRDVPATCPGAAVVEFLEGRYDAVDTARLNRLLNGSCRNKTFWFRPGKYSFDVNDSGASPATDRHALVMNDATAKIVFGAPNGWTAGTGAPSDGFPRACNAGRSGASIQLSGRTTIRHRAGRVAICPAFNPVTETPLPAIVQSDNAPSQPILVSSTRPAGGWFPTAYTRCFHTVLFVSAWVPCVDYEATKPAATRSFDTIWASTGSAPLTSARLRFQSKETPPVHNARRLVKVVVYSASNVQICQTGYLEGGRTNGQFTEIDLRSETGTGGTCVGALSAAGVTEGIFEGARLRIEHQYRDAGGNIDPACPATGGTRSGCTVELWVGEVEMITNSTLVAPTSVSSSAWSPAGNASVRDQVAATVAQSEKCTGLGLPLDLFLLFYASGGDPRCRHEIPGPRQIVFDGFDPTTGGLFDADDSVEALGIVVDGRSTPAKNWASLPIDETSARFDLTLAGAATPACSVEFEGFFRSVRTAHVDLFEEGGTCRAAVETMGQLVGARVSMTIVANCLWIDAFRSPVVPWSGRCDTVTLPEIDRLALEVTSDSVPPAPTAEIAMAASSGGASGTSFNVFGDTLLPSLDLDIRWRGQVTELPVFGGFLSLNALGSRQEAGGTVGVVCCTPPPVTTLRLQALIEGTPVGEAYLYVGPSGSAGVPPDVPSARRQVQVLDWRFCGQRGCPPPGAPASVLGSVQTTSTTAPPDPGG